MAVKRRSFHGWRCSSLIIIIITILIRRGASSMRLLMAMHGCVLIGRDMYRPTLVILAVDLDQRDESDR